MERIPRRQVLRGRRERELAAGIGRLGVWNGGLAAAPAARARRAAAEMEKLGYTAIWLPEGGKDVFVNAAILLAATERIIVATSIASIWIRDPYAMATAARTLGDAYPGRFVLGVGVGHPGSSRWDGSRYERPLAHMRSYLDAMDRELYWGPVPRKPVQRVLAALGPRMLALAAERSRGANSYLVPVQHTAYARGELGPEPALAVELPVVLGRTAGEARTIARGHLDRYLGLDNYANNLRRMGWSDRDLEGGGNDRLVDAIVAWGPVGRIVERIQAHLEAGADHVCVHPLTRDQAATPMAPLRKIAAAFEEGD